MNRTFQLTVMLCYTVIYLHALVLVLKFAWYPIGERGGHSPFVIVLSHSTLSRQ